MNKHLFTLDSKVSIYVPSTNDVNRADKNRLQKRYVNLIIKEFSEMFGGATATAAVGGWFSQDKGVVTEKITIVYAYCTKEAFTKSSERVLEIAHQMCVEMHQEAITVEYNGKVAFITPDYVS